MTAPTKVILREPTQEMVEAGNGTKLRFDNRNEGHERKHDEDAKAG
jgi:hypothetical protein